MGVNRVERAVRNQTSSIAGVYFILDGCLKTSAQKKMGSRSKRSVAVRIALNCRQVR